jgi:expansin (peptidoglycan-binding protein)
MRGKSLATALGTCLASLAGVAILSALTAVSCGSHQSTDCKGAPGDEFCACASNGSCNSGLACAADLNQCLQVSGTGGATGAGDTTGSGNTTGAAGRAGTGAGNTTGSAGTGSTGTAGHGGATGGGATTGAAGHAGTSGSAGHAGTSGGAGTSGRAGTTGTAGTTGRAGTTGAAGTSGAAGTTGSGSTSCTNLGTSTTNGSFTYYYFGQGTPKSGPNGTYQTACGYLGTESGMTDTVEEIATMSPASGTYFAAIPGASGSTFDTVNDCGACAQITNGGKSIIVTIIDECPEDSNAPCKSDPTGHLDLSYSALNALGYSNGDPSGTTWKMVPCPVTGNVFARIKSGNPNQVFIENSVLAITNVTMNGSGGQHLNYGPWQMNGNVAGQTLTLTDKAGRTLQITANGSADQQYDTGKQFPKCQ